MSGNVKKRNTPRKVAKNASSAPLKKFFSTAQAIRAG
jgi:hypothetical protein